jgi:cutinase
MMTYYPIQHASTWLTVIPNLRQGVVVGPLVAKTLESKIANMADDATLWVQGVGIPYTASIIDSVSPLRTSQDAIDKAVELFNRANELCADTPILAAGYNQGTAVIARAIEDLEQPVKDQIAGVALFGYTLNRQNSGLIPGFPEERTQVYCRWFDLTCRGVPVPYSSLYLHEAHHEGPDFLAGQLP